MGQLAPGAQARWLLRPVAPPEAVRELSRTLSVPPLLAAILHGRDLGASVPQALQPLLALSPIPQLAHAAERLEHALRLRQRILIHGDYDADGISGTAVLSLGLRALGGDVTPYIPNRLTDGYGIHPERVPEHAERAEVFLTVDCGISNLSEIRALQDKGVEVIVTDHHQPGQTMPGCLVVHPKLSPLAKPGLPELTGAGLAFHLLWALHERLGLEPPLEYADLATLGTVADVAPLLGENRALVIEGLRRMAASRWPGLRASIAQTRIQGQPSARDVAFVLAPRLNAAGRLGEAEMGLELLMTSSERRARELAVYLDARNDQRRKVQDEMFEEALTLCDPDAPALVLSDPGWHPGVMGIVASKVLERHYKPVFIMAQGKGSVRSTPGISAVAGLHAAAPHLLRYGGHSAAAGFAMREDALEQFRESIYAFVRQYEPPERVLLADALLSAQEMDADLLKGIDLLEPYGEGHPAPAFLFSGALESARAVGASGSTLQLRVGGMKGVAWQRGNLARHLRAGDALDLSVSLRENDWNGQRSTEFLAEDLRSSAPLTFAPPFDPSAEMLSVGADLIRRGPPDTASGNVRHLLELPLGDEPLELCKPLETLIAQAQQGGVTLHFDLDDAALERLVTALAELPTLHEVRRGYVCRQRGHALPYDAVKNALVERALQELGLLDAHGRPLRGVKRDPYSSDTLLAGLLERYKLNTFIKAYRRLDDAAFAQSVLTLFVEQRTVPPDTTQHLTYS